jgi:multiple sugar transport system substrate-binding protein
MRTRWLIGGCLTVAAIYGAQLASAAVPAPTERYDGVKITAALHSGSFVRQWTPFLPRLKELYGIELELVGIPVNELYDKEILELSTGTGAYDLVMLNPGWMGDYVDYLLPLDDYMEKSDPAWEDIHEGFRVWENTYEGQRYTLTMDGDVILLYYRKDLFDNPDEQAAFRQKYGYDLAPPETWEQVLDVAEFFRRDTNGDGEIDFFGYADQPKRGRSFYWYLIRYIAYSSPDPQYFDPDTMTPRINTPEAVAALENYKAAIDLAPPGVLGWEWDELFNSFIQGKIAMMLHWPDEGKHTRVLAENVPDAIMGFGLPPGVKKDGQLYRRTMTFGGWIIGVTKDSANPEAAYLALNYMLSPEVSTLLVLTPGGGMDFFRKSHFTSPVSAALAPQEYLETYNRVIDLNFPELRIPGGFEYYDTLDIAVQKALAGEATPKDALDEAAAKWEEITERFGRDEQKAKYAAAMGLKQ